MSEYRFYVVNDLISGHKSSVEYFEDVRVALDRYLSLENNTVRLPALGIEAGNGGLDLIHGINGENVLVPDYRRQGLTWSPEMQSVLNDVNKFVEMFVLEGVVQREFLTVPLVDSVRTIVPATLSRDDYDDGYCNDKTLKTSRRNGLDGIDSLFIQGHGWVVYSDLVENPEKYCSDGFLYVDAMNVAYIRDKNVVGLDGRMDVCPSDFAKMVERINKPYVLVAYDANDYNFQYKGKHDYIVASYDNLSDSVKAWYDFKEKHPEAPMYVGHQERGRESAVFNGVNDDFEALTRAEAAKIYGFDMDENTVDALIADAGARCEPTDSHDVKNIDYTKD